MIRELVFTLIEGPYKQRLDYLMLRNNIHKKECVQSLIDLGLICCGLLCKPAVIRMNTWWMNCHNPCRRCLRPSRRVSCAGQSSFRSGKKLALVVRGGNAGLVHFSTTFDWLNRLAIADHNWLELYCFDGIQQCLNEYAINFATRRHTNRYVIAPTKALFWPHLLGSHAARILPFSPCHLLSFLCLYPLTSITSPLSLFIVMMVFILYDFCSWPYFRAHFWCYNDHYLNSCLQVRSHWPLFR